MPEIGLITQSEVGLDSERVEQQGEQAAGVGDGVEIVGYFLALPAHPAVQQRGGAEEQHHGGQARQRQAPDDAANAGGLGDLIGRQVEGGDGHDGERRGGEHLEVWRLAHEPSGPAVTEEQRDLEEDHAAQPGAGRAAVDGQQAFAHDRLDGEAEERGEGYGGDDQDGQRLRQEVFGAVGVVHF